MSTTAVVEIDTDECDAARGMRTSTRSCTRCGTIYLPKLNADQAVVVDMRHLVSP